mmetsp:Transcript_148955/g.263096  ORF Transcript_148955/g.263096 Transcript_148955/m.263096 type:complete len:130 (+) Transcript_148955:82-471(+)
MITQGCYSYLPPLTSQQLVMQIDSALKRGLGLGIEYTYDPHPRNSYWEMWGNPRFTFEGVQSIVYELAACAKAHPEAYIKLLAFDQARGTESCVLSFIYHRPSVETAFRLVRQEASSRKIIYTLEPTTA